MSSLCCPGFGNGFWKRTRGCAFVVAALVLMGTAGHADAQAGSPVVLDRGGERTIVVEPWAENIVRVTLSREKAATAAKPGYGFVGVANGAGWTREKDAAGFEVLRSSRMVVRIAPENYPKPHALKLDDLNMQLRDHYFGGVPDPNPPLIDPIAISAADGKPLLKLQRWAMMANKVADVPGAKDAAEAGSKVSAVFDAPQSEHLYGLGQQQQGLMDLHDHSVSCWLNYNAVGGENICIPFLLSSRGYGLIWDNPSKTTVDLGFNLQTVWTSEVGDRVSFFVIAGSNDELYKGYRALTGVTHLLPKGAYGFIQSKAIYPTQEQALAVAKGYRDRNLPLDMLVVDFLNMTRQGEMDMEPTRWPDTAAMNKQLHAMGVETMLSVWPHYSKGTQFYDELLKKGWFIHTPDGQPELGWGKPVIGPNLDTTNPEAGRWYWEKIRERYLKPFAYDAIWLDETEPDYDPAKDVYWAGPGTKYFNLYPLTHTSAVYEGWRRDFGDSKRAMNLARAAYLGAQRNGTIFWSSDIYATWDMLKRSVPAGLEFAASGMAYWDTDIAGFFSPQIAEDYHAQHKPLIDAKDAMDNVGNYEDYPELFVRWYEWGAFQPVMRAHGERMHNEVWAYGKQAEGILSKYLRLRYQLIPYTYAQAYNTYETGAPYMRALFLDFPNDENAADIRDEYMYGPAFLVAPVTDQGATSRKVYLPAGGDWYNYWTNERVKGGQTITVDAPIETLPLFVRTGSIVPLGTEILTTKQKQEIAKVKVYAGADGEFTLFHDDGTSYAYEKGAGEFTKLHWNNATQTLTHTGAAAWSSADAQVVEVVGK